MKKKIRIIKVSQQQVNKGEKTERTIWSTLLKKISEMKQYTVSM